MGEIGGEIYSTQVRAGSNASSRRLARNDREAKELELNGYRVEKNKHSNGAYFAVIGNTHKEHELEVGKIFAENGFSFTLDREGTAKIKLKDGRRFTLPSPDGRVEGFTHEIHALNGSPNPQSVARGIKHSYKPVVHDMSKSLQSSVAITFTPKGSSYHRRDIADGVKEYKRQKANGETNAKPLIYLHVDEDTRKVYYWSIK